MLLIEAIAEETWWQDVTIPMLEQARRKLRTLIKLMEAKKRRIVYADFEDEVGEGVEINLSIEGAGAGDFECFRLKARAFLRQHESHVALHKLRKNLPLTAVDLRELERMLTEGAVGTNSDIQRATKESRGLGLFVRSLVGLDRDAANAAFSEFVSERALTGNQLEFINLVVSHLTENGVMNAALLYEPPFTSYAPQGPDALFSTAQVEQLFVMLEQIRSNAMVA